MHHFWKVFSAILTSFQHNHLVASVTRVSVCIHLKRMNTPLLRTARCRQHSHKDLDVWVNLKLALDKKKMVVVVRSETSVKRNTWILFYIFLTSVNVVELRRYVPPCCIVPVDWGDSLTGRNGIVEFQWIFKQDQKNKRTTYAKKPQTNSS